MSNTTGSDGRWQGDRKLVDACQREREKQEQKAMDRQHRLAAGWHLKDVSNLSAVQLERHIAAGPRHKPLPLTEPLVPIMEPAKPSRKPRRSLSELYEVYELSRAILNLPSLQFHEWTYLHRNKHQYEERRKWGVK